MKKLYTLALIVLTAGSLTAQDYITKHFDGATKTEHFSTGTTDRYVTGMGTDVHPVKVQKFDKANGVDSYGQITGVRMDFAGHSTTVDSFWVALYEDDNGLPGALVEEKLVFHSEIAATSTAIAGSDAEYNLEVTFDNPYYIPGNQTFWVGLWMKTFNTTAGQVLGLWGTGDGQFSNAATHTYTRSQLTTGFSSFPDEYGLDIALAIFPIAQYVTGVNELEGEGLTVSQNYPNPFNGQTRITYQLAETADVSLEVIDMTGRKVMVINQGEQPSGVYDMFLDSKTLQSGIYFYTLEAGNQTITKKMIVK